MRTKSYKYGRFRIKTYFKKAGAGYECGLHFAGKPVFVGNFVHSKEATAWYATMNREVRNFSKKYWVSETAPKNWYKNFLASHIHKMYYSYLDKLFSKYNRDYERAFNKDVRKYKQLKKNWHHTDKATFKAA